MKNIKTKKLGACRVELLMTDNKTYIILFKYKDYSYEILRSSFSSVITEYFNNIQVTDNRDDGIQFCYSHTSSHYVYFEFYYANTDMNELDIDLKHHTKENQDEAISGYYDSLDEVKRIYGDSYEQIIIECIFESSIY